MTPRQFYVAYKESDKTKIEEVCKAAGTSFANFQQIAIADGAVGKGLAKRLSEASEGEMSVLEILYPEDFKESAA